MIGTIKALQAA